MSIFKREIESHCGNGERKSFLLSTLIYEQWVFLDQLKPNKGSVRDFFQKRKKLKDKYAQISIKQKSYFTLVKIFVQFLPFNVRIIKKNKIKDNFFFQNVNCRSFLLKTITRSRQFEKGWT